MTTIPKKAKHITELPICWIKKGENYRLHTKTKGNNLPVISITDENKDILQNFGASYKKVRMAEGEKYEYWNKKFYETEKLTLPTYIFMCGEYHYLGENTFENPTRKTLDEARKIEEKIKSYLSNQGDQEENLQSYEGDVVDILKQILNDKPSRYIFSYSFDEDEEYETADDHFYVFVLKTYQGKPTGHVLLFNRRKFYSKVKIEVPEDYIPYIIGREGCNVKRWAEKMKVGKIKVISQKIEIKE